MVVMVPGKDDDLAVRSEALAERFQNRSCDRERVPGRSLAKLDNVAEEDESISVAERFAERCQDGLVAQDVALGVRAQMQV
jgi:hypothetical protein